MARISEFSLEIAEQVCDIIATSNKGLHAILSENNEFPSEKTFFNWLATGNKELLQLYARAKDMQADRLAAEILAIIV